MWPCPGTALRPYKAGWLYNCDDRLIAIASLPACLDDELLLPTGSHHTVTPAMHDRIRLYRSVLPVEEALFGLEHGDASALQAGLDALTGNPSPGPARFPPLAG